MKICIVAGARPDFMKIAPLIHVLERYEQEGKTIHYQLIYTGSETDKSLEPGLFRDLEITPPSVYLNIESNDHIERLSGIMLAFDRYLQNYPTDTVIVIGDLTPTMACTIVAKKRNIKVAHIAAGTRSFNPEAPKEMNQIITDALSDYFFTAGMVSNRNLRTIGTEIHRVHFVGNILIDTLRKNRKKISAPTFFTEYGFKETAYLLFTINRRVLLNNPLLLKKIINTILIKAPDIPVIAPLQEKPHGIIRELFPDQNNLVLLPSQSYLHFSYLVAHAKGILTDSGNIAEEATFLSVPCITLNTFVEHPETFTIGTNFPVGEDTELLASTLQKMMSGEWQDGRIPERWDGYTAERIIQTLCC